MLFITCKKHPEGGYKFRNKHAFFKSGGTDWDLTHYLVNGIDSTASVCSNPAMLMPYVRFEKYSYSPRYFCQGATREFGLHDQSISVLSGANHTNFKGEFVKLVLTPPGSYKEIVWQIRKCTKKELILESQVEERVYRLEFNLHK
jgi:hypothetical protein